MVKMRLSVRSGLRIAPPVSWDGRLFVPVVRILAVSHGRGVIASCTPVALLIGEGDSWSFVSLEEGITQEDLGEPGLLPPGG
jgi:hypothetical protein